MDYVATFIAPQGHDRANLAVAREMASLLPFGRIGPTLDGNHAIDVTFMLDDYDDDFQRKAEQGMREDCAETIGKLPVDCIVQRDDAFRRKRLLIADMDSTMIGQECIDELADFAGVKAHVSAITERAMRGEIAFEPALRERVALLKGLPATIVEEVIAKRITLTPGARTLVATMKKHGATAALVSGGFDVFTSRIAAMIGFDSNQANRLLVADGRFTGEVAEPILGRAAKKAALEALCKTLALDPRATLAVGDGANDLDMLQASGLGIAYRAKPAVAAAAHAAVEHGDLTALLFAQGYRRSEFAQA